MKRASKNSQEQSSEEDEKATLNTTRFQPEVRRSKRVIGKRPKRKKNVTVDLTMELNQLKEIIHLWMKKQQYLLKLKKY